MRRISLCFSLFVAGLLALPAVAAAQPFALLGARPSGMGGAFVGVADDASAFYWNPAGLAAGAIVSAVLDVGSAQATPDGFTTGRDGSSVLLALSTPALGVGYYRLRSTATFPPVTLSPIDDPGSGRNLTTVAELRVDSLVTHHAGVTLVQSLAQGIAVGATLKLVRGIAASQTVPTADPESALEVGADLLGQASNRFDLDIGGIAYGGPLKIGLALRNVREPAFAVPGGVPREIVLERQLRIGASYAISDAWVAAFDADLLETSGPFGDERELAVGAEGRLTPRFWVRSGLTVNTAEADEAYDDRRAASLSFGSSYAVRGGVLVDGYFATGSGRAGMQWGVAARFLY